MVDMTVFRERVWPAPWLFIATALVIPASLLVFLPIAGSGIGVGIVVAIVLYAGCVGLLLLGSPLVEVTDTELIAGRGAAAAVSRRRRRGLHARGRARAARDGAGRAGLARDPRLGRPGRQGHPR